MTQKTLLAALQKRLLLAISVSFFITLISLTIIHKIDQNHFSKEIETHIQSFLEDHEDILASQIYINNIYSLPLDPTLIEDLQKLKLNAKIAIFTPNNKCLLGDCLSFKTLEKTKTHFFSRPLKVSDDLIATIYIWIQNEKKLTATLNIPILSMLISSIILFIFNQIIFSQFIHQKITSPIKKLLTHFKDLERGRLSLQSLQTSSALPFEIDTLLIEFKRMANTLEQLHIEQRNHYAKEKLYVLATQVAHDIRAPLAALNIDSHHLKLLPEEDRILIRHATQRIHDIANHLLAQHKNPQALIPPEETSPQWIAHLIDVTLSEKRIQLEIYTHLKIEPLILDPSNHFIFSNIHPSDFKRMISNLIDNAAESILSQNTTTPGVIHTQLTLTSAEQNPSLQISIIDNGPGINAFQLQQIQNGVILSSKKTGTGLGLKHAKYSIQKWGGHFKIQTLQTRTEIQITLPIVPPPHGFVTELQLHSTQTVIIIDDDPQIHTTWIQRFKELTIFTGTLLHFNSPAELQSAWDQTSLSPSILFLIDYDFTDTSETGIALIEKLGILQYSILVTHLFDEPQMQQRCQNISLKLLPKKIVPTLTMNCSQLQ